MLFTLLAVVGGFICYMIYLCKRKCEAADEPNLGLTSRHGVQHQNVNNFNDAINPNLFNQEGTTYVRNP